MVEGGFGSSSSSSVYGSDAFSKTVQSTFSKEVSTGEGSSSSSSFKESAFFSNKIQSTFTKEVSMGKGSSVSYGSRGSHISNGSSICTMIQQKPYNGVTIDEKNLRFISHVPVLKCRGERKNSESDSSEKKKKEQYLRSGTN
jgi:hypothetical protein